MRYRPSNSNSTSVTDEARWVDLKATISAIITFTATSLSFIEVLDPLH